MSEALNEMKNKAIELNDEELAKAAGGIIPREWGSYECPNCFRINYYSAEGVKPICPCGYNPKTGKVTPPSDTSAEDTSNEKRSNTPTSLI